MCNRVSRDSLHPHLVFQDYAMQNTCAGHTLVGIGPTWDLKLHEESARGNWTTQAGRPMTLEWILSHQKVLPGRQSAQICTVQWCTPLWLQSRWCERCLLITESPKTPSHYRYLIWVLVYIPYTGLAVFSFAISRVPVYTAISIS